MKVIIGKKKFKMVKRINFKKRWSGKCYEKLGKSLILSAYYIRKLYESKKYLRNL